MASFRQDALAAATYAAGLASDDVQTVLNKALTANDPLAVIQAAWPPVSILVAGGGGKFDSRGMSSVDVYAVKAAIDAFTADERLAVCHAIKSAAIALNVATYQGPGGMPYYEAEIAAQHKVCDDIGASHEARGLLNWNPVYHG